MSSRVDLTKPLVPPLAPGSNNLQLRVSKETLPDFNKVLNQALEEKTRLCFSRHAEERIKMREINLTLDQLQRVDNGVEQAARKGCQESLVLLDDVAFIVSVINRTVVTALNGQDLKDNVFTNIDSAIIV